MANEPEYVFTRDYLDNNRINLQHYQWVELFGYHLHPSISITNEQLRVADVATGTGSVFTPDHFMVIALAPFMGLLPRSTCSIWLTDMSSRLPSTVQLDGLDISLKATPPEEWLPSTVNFRKWDMRHPVPGDLIEKYDVVHVRLMAFVLHDEELPSILENIVKLIKPGGYLQWAEPDVASFHIVKTRADNPTVALTSLLKLSQSQDSRLSPKWVPGLPALFEGAGRLCQVVTDVRQAPGHLALAMHECNLMLHEMLVRTTNKDATFAADLERLLPRVAEETRQGAVWAFTRWTVVGRKPTL